MGARFAKWRAVIYISDTLPSYACISANAHALARYAALCQEENLVPIVEPEVLMDGSHSIERCEEITGAVLHAVFSALHDQRVLLERMLLKPSMVIAGQRLASSGVGSASRHRHLALFASPRPRRSAGHRVLVGRSGRSGGNGPLGRNQSTSRDEAMEDQFFLRPRASGPCAGDVAWPGRESGRWSASAVPTCPL